MSVTVHFDPPLVQIKHEVEDFEREIEDFTPLWDDIANLMGDVELERWSTDGFGTWAPLAESTIRQKGHDQILVDTFDLLQSLSNPERGTLEKDAHHLVYGTDVSYAHWHQDGGYKPGRPPRRVILDIPAEYMPKIDELAVKFVNEVAVRSFGA